MRLREVGLPDPSKSAVLRPPARIGFIGLGQMGIPMARRLLEAGFQLCGSDLLPAARAGLEAAGGIAAATPQEAAEGAAALITMLPDGRIVRDVLLGSGKAAESLGKGTLIIDMSSSTPLGTRRLGDELRALGLRLVDAPVSGGVKRAIDGTLTIMAGGDPEDVQAAADIFAALGRNVFRTGALGSGHAMKALNNYVSGAGLAAAAEAMLVGRAFGLDPELMIDVLNASTGRNNATENKMKQFVLSETFASGFALGLMAKDIRIAAELAGELGLATPLLTSTAELWDLARDSEGAGADHTEIYRHLEGRGGENHGDGQAG